ncbi:amidohydrolase family protein [Bacillus sp. Marseille-P3661]|uniref:amidohydrolase family protein n=1 Tax=Bacillus sp. Marseille-P3661 TaxID=1936234 RepID=UPI000C85E51E|nr:amidohydrolase family protein [Bacillus sp. Marseille-P3661]
MSNTTPDNTPKLIDTDVHNSLGSRAELLPYLPKVWHKQWLDTGENVSGYYSQIGQRRKDAYTPSGGNPGSDPHFLLEHHVDKYNIDYAILTHSTLTLGLCVHYDPDYANGVISAHNDHMVEQWLSVSPKYKGSILINPSDPEAAVKEIERMAKHPDMIQVMMASASPKLYGQRFYHPIYEAAERNGLPVGLHPGMEGSTLTGAPTPSGFPTRYFEYHNLLPTNFMAQVNSFVCEGVFEKFPNLTVVAIEGGISWLPHLMWRMDKNYKALRDTVPWLKKKPSEYIKKHIRLTTQPIEEPENPLHLRQIFEMCDAEDIIMFSSDYPHWDFDHPGMVLNHLPREMRDKIKAKNAIDLYGLNQKVSENTTV